MLQSCVSYELYLARSIDSCWMLEARLPIQYALNALESASRNHSFLHAVYIILTWPGQNPHQSSGWTPLHQAVFMGAHRDRIVSLIEDFGALRMPAPLSSLMPSSFSHYHNNETRLILILDLQDFSVLLGPTRASYRTAT
jgi:hypothetical protein